MDPVMAAYRNYRRAQDAWFELEHRAFNDPDLRTQATEARAAVDVAWTAFRAIAGVA